MDLQSDSMRELQAALQKKENGKFTFEDLNNFLRDKVNETTAVTPLTKGKWVKVGKYWLQLKTVNASMDEIWAYILTSRDIPILSLLLKLLALIKNKGNWVWLGETFLTQT
jgi:hypothetical protein